MSETITPGYRADDTRQYVRGLYPGELIDVTCLNRPDPSWTYTDSRGHVHRWYVNGKPATTYSPSATYQLPTLIRIIDVPSSDDYPGIAHWECRECRKLDAAPPATPVP